MFSCGVQSKVKIASNIKDMSGFDVPAQRSAVAEVR